MIITCKNIINMYFEFNQWVEKIECFFVTLQNVFFKYSEERALPFWCFKSASGVNCQVLINVLKLILLTSK